MARGGLHGFHLPREQTPNEHEHCKRGKDDDGHIDCIAGPVVAAEDGGQQCSDRTPHPEDDRRDLLLPADPRYPTRLRQLYAPGRCGIWIRAIDLIRNQNSAPEPSSTTRPIASAPMLSARMIRREKTTIVNPSSACIPSTAQ